MSSRKQNLKILIGCHGNLGIHIKTDTGSLGHLGRTQAASDIWDGHRQPRTSGTNMGSLGRLGHSEVREMFLGHSDVSEMFLGHSDVREMFLGHSDVSEMFLGHSDVREHKTKQKR